MLQAKAHSNIPSFDPQVSEYQIAEFIDECKKLNRQGGIPGTLLDVRQPFYSGRGANEVSRIRGYIMASYEQVGLPGPALPIILETLESGKSIYTIAAAAKAVRGMPKPEAHVIPFLLAAVRNVYFRDDVVSYDRYAPKPPLTNPTSALREILTTFQWLAPVAEVAIPQLEGWLLSDAFNDENRALLETTITKIKNTTQRQDACCEDTGISSRISSGVSRRKVLRIKLQDQDGHTTTFGNFFKGKPCVIVFFYTRCSNQNKCSLTINKLGQLQRILDKKGLAETVRTAAITYDPIFDSPERIKHYGLQRRRHFNEDHRNFRVLNAEQMPVLLDHFKSSTSYFGQVVSEHAIELYILDANGHTVREYLRLQWDPSSIANDLEQYISRNHGGGWIRRAGNLIPGPLLSILIAFFPKCPFCWAAYMSLIGVAGIGTIPYSPWLLPMLCALLGVHVYLLFRNASRRSRWLPFYSALAGATMLVLFGSVYRIEELLLTGMIFMIAGSVINSLPEYRYRNLASAMYRLKQLMVK